MKRLFSLILMVIGSSVFAEEKELKQGKKH